MFWGILQSARDQADAFWGMQRDLEGLLSGFQVKLQVVYKAQLKWLCVRVLFLGACWSLTAKTKPITFIRWAFDTLAVWLFKGLLASKTLLRTASKTLLRTGFVPTAHLNPKTYCTNRICTLFASKTLRIKCAPPKSAGRRQVELGHRDENPRSAQDSHQASQAEQAEVQHAEGHAWGSAKSGSVQHKTWHLGKERISNKASTVEGKKEFGCQAPFQS